MITLTSAESARITAESYIASDIVFYMFLKVCGRVCAEMGGVRKCPKTWGERKWDYAGVRERGFANTINLTFPDILFLLHLIRL